MVFKISIVIPVFNEELNIEKIYTSINLTLKKIKSEFKYEIIFIDNCSEDSSANILKDLAKSDRNIKVILNTRNFGPMRSPFYALLNSTGDASILLSADFQEPPELIPTFVEEWLKGHKIVIGIKNKSKENFFIFFMRKLFYYLIKKMAEIEHIDQFTGFGLYDKSVISTLKKYNEPLPYFRGLIADIGYERKEINFTQPKRIRGKSSTNFFSLVDFAILGFVNYSKVPLRMATYAGFVLSLISLLTAFGYFIYKIVNWNSFQLGIAPAVIGVFFFGSIQLLFLGIIGEYIASIFNQTKNRPLVIEKERINF